MRDGLDADDRDSREHVFGKNVIDIQQKSIPQLLVDEVSTSGHRYFFFFFFFSLPSLADMVFFFFFFWKRPFIHSTFSKLPVSLFGHWMNIIIMPSASFLFLSSVLALR